MGNTLKIVLFTIVSLTFVGVGTNYVIQSDNKISLRNLEVKALTSDLDELNLKYNNLNIKLKDATNEKTINQKKVDEISAEKQKLEAEKKRLEAELQAKAEAKSKLAQASEKVVNGATGTATASASSGDVKQIIIAAANKYGVDANHALRIAECESTYTPSSVNYNYWVDAKGREYGTEGGKFYPSGLFQHVSLYWPARAAKYGYAGASVLDPVANANVTMGMFRDGSSNLWECK